MKRYKNYLGRNFSKDREEDKISPETRSKVMSKIRSTGTKLEETFIQKLDESTKTPFVLNDHELRGKPDIVFKEEKVCVFIDHFDHLFTKPLISLSFSGSRCSLIYHQ